MVLGNDCKGIGMGWRTHVPNYNPTEIIDNLIRLMQGDPVLPMRLWYEGFRGTIEHIPSNILLVFRLPQQVTFVNLFNTIKGGPLVDFMANEIAEHLVNIINEKHNFNLTPDDVKKIYGSF
ncbi:hypothetical protein ACFX1X_005607 [Malus domestica]